MPEISEVSSYLLGVRIMQALRMLSDGDAISETEIEAALLRLQVACGGLSECDGKEHLLVHLTQVVNRSLVAHGGSIGLPSGNDQLVCSEQRLRASSLAVSDNLARVAPRDAAWLRLGMLIADGRDEVWSDGTLMFRDRQYPDSVPPEDRSRYQGLTSINPVPRRWEWNDEQSLRDLATELDVQMDDLFQQNRAIRDDTEIFSGLQFKRYWGWHAIEFGLNSLRSPRIVPHWNAGNRTLYFDHRVIHSFGRNRRSTRNC